MSELRVKTTIVFEAEYYINTAFYDSDIPEEVVAQEQRYCNINPDIMIDTLKYKGNFSSKVETVPVEAIAHFSDVAVSSESGND